MVPPRSAKCVWLGSILMNSGGLETREHSGLRILLLQMHADAVGGVARFSRAITTSLKGWHEVDEVTVISRRQSKFTRAEQCWYASEALVRALRMRPTLVIASHTHLAPVAVIVAKLTGAAVSVLCHGREAWRLKPGLTARSIKAADQVWAPSDFTIAALVAQGVSPTKCIRLPPPVTTFETGVEDNHEDYRVGGRILTVARLDPASRYKGVDTLIRALPKIITNVPNAHLIVVGDGSDRLYLETLAQRYNIIDKVTFRGYVDDEGLRREYSRARVFALPAKTELGQCPKGEGFGIVLIEAAAAGLPVVTGNQGALPEVVQDAFNGYTVEPQPGDVADAVTRILTDAGLWSRLSANGLTVASQFSRSAFDQQLRAICMLAKT